MQSHPRTPGDLHVCGVAVQAGWQVLGGHEGAGVGVAQGREEAEQAVRLLQEAELRVEPFPLRQACTAQLADTD